MTNHPVPLDDYPYHQSPMSFRTVGTTDKNMYDRYYFNVMNRGGDVMMVTGLGHYPNLGVIDAMASVAYGDRLISVRASDALDADRRRLDVGPFHIEIVEPLHRLRVVCEPHEHDLAFDLTWNSSCEAVEEPRHISMSGPKAILDACRFAQLGTWSGTLSVAGIDFSVTPDQWLGSRDRSWGIRPVGEPDPAGRTASEPDPAYGFWWTYVPFRFDDYCIVIIAQEDGKGTRTINEAVRVWSKESGRGIDQLGWPRFDIHYRPGTRTPTGARIHMAESDGSPVVMEIETMKGLALSLGSGYGAGTAWSHGVWKGRNWLDRIEIDLTDPETVARAAFSMVDWSATATIGGDRGYGLFEHGTFGAHLPSGFTDFGSVAGSGR
jgi:hypothetical protein